jgi:hypothetical protein
MVKKGNIIIIIIICKIYMHIKIKSRMDFLLRKNAPKNVFNSLLLLLFPFGKFVGSKTYWGEFPNW